MKIVTLPCWFILKLIRVYQVTLSFDHGFFKFLYPYGYCRYKPSCSEYAYQAIDGLGLIKGGLMAVWRVFRCNPWSKGGVDYPTKNNQGNTHH